MGSDVTENGLKFQMQDRLRPIITQLHALQASGGDGKDVDVETTYKSSKSFKSRGQQFLLPYAINTVVHTLVHF